MLAAKDRWSLLTGLSEITIPCRGSCSLICDLVASWVSMREREPVDGIALLTLALGDTGRLWDFDDEGEARSSRTRGLEMGVMVRELRAAGGPLGGRREGHSPLSGLSWLARCKAKVRALVVLYLRMGARPATRLRQVKQVGVEQCSAPQPSRSWMMYLRR